MSKSARVGPGVGPAVESSAWPTGPTFLQRFPPPEGMVPMRVKGPFRDRWMLRRRPSGRRSAPGTTAIEAPAGVGKITVRLDHRILAAVNQRVGQRHERRVLIERLLCEWLRGDGVDVEALLSRPAPPPGSCGGGD